MDVDALQVGQETKRAFISTSLSVTLILVFSLTLNLWGNRWGAPDYWNPDELTKNAIIMFDTRTIKPNTYFYGGLHYYVLAVGAVFPARVYEKAFDPKPNESDIEIHSKWKERRRIRTICFARSISALMTTSQVFLTFLIGNLLFGETIGVLAALFLCVSPYLIAVGHFATVDAPANFWYWLSCFFALKFWKRKRNVWLVLACITAGLTFGTKIDRMVILFPLLFAYMKGVGGGEFRKLLKFIPFVIAGYLLANPSLLFSTIEFLDGTTRDLFFNMIRSDPDATSTFTQILAQMKSGMGVLLFLAAVGGLGYAAWNFLINKDRDGIGWLLSSLVPFYLLIGSHLSYRWYVPFFFPALTIFAAYGCQKIQEVASPNYRMAMRGVPTLIVLTSFLFSLSLVLQFTNDSRYLVAKWIEEHIPVGASIYIGERGPAISNNKNYLIQPYQDKTDSDREKFDIRRQWRERLDQNKTYLLIRRWILDLEQFTARISGRPARKEPYQAWFDYYWGVPKNETVTERDTVVVKADYIILIDPVDRAKILANMLPDSGYRVIEKIQYRNPLGIQIPFTFVNPEIYIFAKY